MTFKDKTLLLGVGAAKSGTSWLYEYCKGHQQIGVSPIKEIHYFDQIFGDRRAFRNLWKRNLRKTERKVERLQARQMSKPEIIREQTEKALAMKRRLELLNSNPMTHEKYYEFIEHYINDHDIFADITPAYCLLTGEQYKNIKSSYEKIKVLFIMRDPVRRFYSQVRMGQRTTKSQKNVQVIQPVKNFEKILQRPDRTSRGDYKTTITNLEMAFDPSELHFAFYEDFFTDESLKGLCKFLEIEFIPGKYDEKVNFAPNPKRVPPKLAKMARRQFSEIYDFCRNKFENVPESWMD